MTLPVAISIAEGAIRAVPAESRTVRLSLGATTRPPIRHQVLPPALPLDGELVEVDTAARISTGPADRRAGDYVTGRLG